MVMVQQRRDRPWVFADLEAFPEDRVRYEILAGTLFGLATPGGYHGQANSNLIDLLLPVAKAAGVPEYWIVDPDPQAPTVEVLALEGNALRSRSTFAGQERVASAVLPGVGFAAAEVFAGFDEIVA